jgi:hypothetical protein
MREVSTAATGTVHGNRVSQAVYIALILLLFGPAAIYRFNLPQVPFIDPDVRGYLVPALSALADHGFQHVEGRSFVYPGFVYITLLLFRDFHAISVIQHLFGLAAGGLLIMCWNCAGRFLGITPGLIYRVAGLGVGALFLFNASVLRFEYLIRPEAIFPFFTVLSLFLNLQFIRLRILAQAETNLRIQSASERQRTEFVYGAFILLNAVLLFFLKPSFYLASLLATVPVWSFLLDREEPLVRRLRMVGLAGAIAFLLLFLPEHFLKSNDPDSKTFLPTTLFLIHANIIREQMKQDIERKAATPYALEFLESTYTLLDQEINLSRQTGRYRSLGFDPDYLMYRDSFDKKFSLSLGPESTDRRIKFYEYYFFRAWSHQPLRMLGKIATELSIVYNSVGKASPYKLEDHTSFGTSYADNHELFVIKLGAPEIQNEILTAFRRDTDKLLRSQTQLIQPKLVSRVNRVFARTFSAFVLLTLVLAAFIMRDPSLRKEYGHYAMITLLFYGYSFFDSLGIAIIHTLEITRYLTNQVIYCLLPQSMTFCLVLELLWRRTVGRRGEPTGI